MAAQLRELRQRIRSTQGLGKIFKAQEVIATTRISRAQARVQAARPYATEITNVLTALAERTGIDPGVVDDVVWGCVNQVGDQAAQIGRYALLAAGWPETVPGVTVNRACGSSQSSFDFAAGMVLAGQYDVVVAGGVESMTRVPLGAGRDLGRPYGPLVRERYRADLESGEFPNGDFNQGVGAERIARDWGLSRTLLDEYAARSHELAAAAIDAQGTWNVSGLPAFARLAGLD